jgi:hypothetical protein
MKKLETWQKFVVDNLGGSISAHNTQPLKFNIHNDVIVFYINEARKLPVGDPHEKDLRTSCGAYIETLDVLLRCQGRRIAGYDEQAAMTGKQFSVTSEATGNIELKRYDPFMKRFSFRGFYSPKDIIEPKVLSKEKSANLKIISDKSIISEIAKMYDEVNLNFLRKAGHLQELYSWLRFSDQHAMYHLDGLNAQAMALQSYEAFFGSHLMKPAVFKALDSIGLAKFLVAEAPKIRSAPGLAIISAPTGSSYVEQGRIFMRAWLDLTEAKLFGAPLSLLTDAPELSETLTKKFEIGNRTLVNVLRIGHLPKRYEAPVRCRLGIEEVHHEY